jgi:hypothetical protein
MALLKTIDPSRSEAGVHSAAQWSVQTRYNEYFENRYTCLVEEIHHVERDRAGLETGEHAQWLVFSLWDVDQSVSARCLPDEEKSSVYEVFGWLPVTIQLRRGSVYTEFRQCPRETLNLTWQRDFDPAPLKSFFHWVNYLLSRAPSALFHPAKIGLLSLVEKPEDSEKHWQDFLKDIGWKDTY